ncbi:MAG TPA: tRNA pseudouridine(13) synthase TruD [Thermoplasmata archaeon]|nr:tRNA pseudouridine(13) synthase TruD [Thermoplasmata archaeon]
MPIDRWQPPAADRTLGLEFYASATPGVAGQLKTSPEEFRVQEVSSYPLPDPDGAFVVLRVESRDWEQHELAAAIGRTLGLPPHALQWSGTKDRRAIAERLFSYRGPLPPATLPLRDVRLVEAYRARDGLVLGHHYGNVFDLTVGELDRPVGDALAGFQAVDADLRQGSGIPNFFGPQRFGEVRPITHEVGRWLVRGDLARAVDVYLADRPAEGTPGSGDLARRAYAEHHDPERALREFPREYRFERTLLEHLARGHPPERAFRALSRDLRTLFVHAYQSWLFNRWVSARHREGAPGNSPEPGDRIVRLARDGTVRGPESVPVGPDNLPECRELVERGRAMVAGPLVGYDTPPSEGGPGATLDRLLEAEAVDRAMFRIPAHPEIASRGAWRPILLPTPPIALAAESERVRFRFALPKGAYATVVLREFLKSGATSVADEGTSKRGF